MSANQSIPTRMEPVSAASPSVTGCIFPADSAALASHDASMLSSEAVVESSEDEFDTETSTVAFETTTTSIESCEAAIQSSLFVASSSIESAYEKTRDLIWTSGHPDHHVATDDWGRVFPCAGPTPAPGLTFPTATWIENTFSSYYTTGVTILRPRLNEYEGNDRKCCGVCLVYFSTVDVFYWPALGANTACLDTHSDRREPASFATIPPTNNTVSTTIDADGFTYTSPSVYVAYHNISASDRCGQVGPIHTSITLSFAPDELSTLEYSSGIFQNFDGAVTKPFDLSNLPCPPQSLIDQQESANLVGAPVLLHGTYAPIIAPPPYIQTLEPAWKSCISFAAFDPAKTLVPASAMAPAPTPTESAGKTPVAAMPSPTFDPPPIQTQPSTDPEVFSLGSWPDKGDYSSSSPYNSAPSEFADFRSLIDLQHSADPTTSANSGNPGRFPSPPGPVPLGVGKEPFGENHAPETPSDGPQLIHYGGPYPVGSLAPATNNAQNGDAIVGAGTTAIMQHGILDPGVGLELVVGHSTLLLPVISSDQIFTTAGQTVTVLADGSLNIAGTTIKASDPAITLQGIQFSVIGSKITPGQFDMPLPEAGPGYIFTAAGQTFTLLGSSRVAIDGTILSAKSPGITVSGTATALREAVLWMGDGPISSAKPTSSSTSNTNQILDIADYKLTQLDDGTFIVDGVTVSVNEGLVVDPKTSLPQTITPAVPTNAVVIDGVTMRAANGLYTVSSTTFTLVTGSAGVILSWQNGKSSGIITSATLGQSFFLNAAGTLVPQTGTNSHADVGALVAAIMHGFGPSDVTSIPGATAAGADPSADVARSSSKIGHPASEGGKHQVKSVSGTILLSCIMAMSISL